VSALPVRQARVSTTNTSTSSSSRTTSAPTSARTTASSIVAPIITGTSISAIWCTIRPAVPAVSRHRRPRAVSTPISRRSGVVAGRAAGVTQER
jgi:hypothetical protein